MTTRDKREKITDDSVMIAGNLALENADVPISGASVKRIVVNIQKRASVSYLIVKRCFDCLSSLAVSVVLLIPLAVQAAFCGDDGSSSEARLKSQKKRRD